MASQTITGQDLQYTQDNQRCFAYSGLQQSNTTPFTVLSFTTPSAYIVAIIQINSGIDPSSPGNSLINSARIKFNEIGVAVIAAGTNTDDGPRSERQEVIIPPFTAVDILVDSSATADREFSVVLTGRVYEYLPVRN